MTTPNTPAGWYSDPDGSGGQRFWDGTEWTEHRSPAVGAAPPPPPPPPPPPGAGKHAAPPTEPVSQVTDTDTVAEPESAEPVPRELETAATAPPPPLYSVPPLEAPPRYSAAPQDPPSFAAPAFDAPAFDAPPPPAPKDPRSTLILRYSIGVAVGVAAVVATVLYAVFNGNGASTIALSTPTPTTTATPTTTVTSTETSAPSETPIPTGAPGDAANANMTFIVTALDSATRVTSSSNDLLTKDAQGEFIIVSMDVTNTGTDPAQYSATLQKLIAGGTSYDADPEASYYLGNIYEELAPGDQIHTAVVFDVPSGTVPDSIELHGDAMSPGFNLPFN